MLDLYFNQINGSVTVFRTIRILKVARVLRFLSYIKVIQQIISQKSSSFIYICLLLILLIIVYSLIGTHLYNDKLTFRPEYFRQSFDNFYYSFLSVFQLITLENWNDIEMILLNSSVSIQETLFYLLTLIFLGNYVFLNLFLGVLLDGFTKIKHNEIDEDFCEIKEIEEEITVKIPLKKSEMLPFCWFETENMDKRKMKQKKVKFIYEGIDCKASLWVFKKSNHFRKVCYNVVKSNHFENLVFFVIVLSSFKLTVDEYFDFDNGNEKLISENIDISFNSLFLIESFVKIISIGMFMDRGSYLRDYWNQLDFFIVIVGLMDMYLTSINLTFVKVRLSRFYLFIYFLDFSFVESLKVIENNIS